LPIVKSIHPLSSVRNSLGSKWIKGTYQCRGGCRYLDRDWKEIPRASLGWFGSHGRRQRELQNLRDSRKSCHRSSDDGDHIDQLCYVHQQEEQNFRSEGTGINSHWDYYTETLTRFQYGSKFSHVQPSSPVKAASLSQSSAGPRAYNI